MSGSSSDVSFSRNELWRAVSNLKSVGDIAFAEDFSGHMTTPMLKIRDLVEKGDDVLY
jgi:hypothetical protein